LSVFCGGANAADDRTSQQEKIPRRYVSSRRKGKAALSRQGGNSQGRGVAFLRGGETHEGLGKKKEIIGLSGRINKRRGERKREGACPMLRRNRRTGRSGKENPFSFLFWGKRKGIGRGGKG